MRRTMLRARAVKWLQQTHIDNDHAYVTLQLLLGMTAMRCVTVRTNRCRRHAAFRSLRQSSHVRGCTYPEPRLKQKQANMANGFLSLFKLARCTPHRYRHHHFAAQAYHRFPLLSSSA